MTHLYGRMIDPFHSGRKEVTSTAARMIQTTLETWEGAVRTKREADGTFRIYVGEKYNPKALVATGNVNERAE
jgi:hypothetical protein